MSINVPQNTRQNVYFHIEIGEIWQFIREYMSKHPEDKALIPDLFKFIKRVLLQTDRKPFMTIEQYKNGEVSPTYYENYRENENRFGDHYVSDYFSEKGDFYDLNIVCIVRRDTIEYIDFAKLFYLKLYTYRDDQYLIDSFFHFHYLDNFYGNLDDYIEFLATVMSEIVPLEYATAVEKNIETWIDQVSPHKIPILPVSQNKPGSLDKVLAVDATKSDDEIPNNYVKINTSITKEELIGYFSFLYKEKSENDLPFLSEENVREIFKYGLAIPKETLKEKFHLNCSFRFPKKIIDLAIYKLYRLRFNRDKSNKKSEIVLFFASYLTHYAKALDGEEKLDLIMSNITGKIGGRIGFRMEDYIPDYVQKARFNGF